MLVSIAVILLICGLLLLWRAGKLPKGQGSAQIGAVALILLGTALIFCVLSGMIELPLW